MEKRKKKILEVNIEDIDEIRMYGENSSFITIYSRINKDSTNFQLIFYDTDEDVCAICGGGENVDHSRCEDFTLLSEDEVISQLMEVFNEIDDSDKNNINRNIVEINGYKYTKRIFMLKYMININFNTIYVNISQKTKKNIHLKN